MKYHSTRGGCSGASFEDVLFSGYAADGGLFVPERIPSVSTEVMKRWSQLSYTELAVEIATLFISEEEIPKDDLPVLFQKAFSKFSSPDVMQLVRLKNGLMVAELFHGPTLAFKDLALSVVGQMFEYFLSKSRKHMTVLVGTSGDTGSAAIESVKCLSSVDIVVLLPKGRCTEVQERQMTTVIADNVHVYRVEGTSDDLDLPIQRCFSDVAFSRRHNLCSINSINWVRIMVQIVHYFYSYFQVCPDCSEEVEIVVPTGACGNITGGVIAKVMGLPVKLTCAVNVNDIVARTIDHGDFSVAADVQQTFASAMDIQVPYNVERLLYLLSEQDTGLTQTLMKHFEDKGKLQLTEQMQKKMQSTLTSYRGDNSVILKSIKHCWEENEYILCPHTALAAAYHYNNQETGEKRVAIATASPAKFEEAIEAAGLRMTRSPEIEALLHKPTKFSEMKQGEDWTSILRAKIEDITKSRMQHA